jgi:hypothetical protein
MEPILIDKLLSDDLFLALKNHVDLIKKYFAGKPYSDAMVDVEDRFNRHMLHNLPMLVEIHRSAWFIEIAESIFGERLKPSFAFLSMYEKGGICPPHKDRPQCRMGINLCISQKEAWPFYVERKPYILYENQALAFCGSEQEHHREEINPDNYCNLALFHFVPFDFQGKLD